GFFQTVQPFVQFFFSRRCSYRFLSGVAVVYVIQQSHLICAPLRRGPGHRVEKSPPESRAASLATEAVLACSRTLAAQFSRCAAAPPYKFRWPPDWRGPRYYAWPLSPELRRGCVQVEPQRPPRFSRMRPPRPEPQGRT